MINKGKNIIWVKVNESISLEGRKENIIGGTKPTKAYNGK